MNKSFQLLFLCFRFLFVSSDDSPSLEKPKYDLEEEAKVRARFEQELGLLTAYPQQPSSVQLFQQDNLEKLKRELPPDEYGPCTKHISPAFMRRFRRDRDLWNLAGERYAELSEEERDVYIAKEADLKESFYRRLEDQREAIELFRQELDRMGESHQPQPPSADEEVAPFERYPDHEFAIEESQLYFNWNFASFLLMEHILHNRMTSSMLRKTVGQSNLQAGTTIPLFVDGDWRGWDHVLSCSAKGNEAKWHLTGYYKVHPPNDEFIPDDPIEEDSMGAIPFNLTSIRRYLQNIRDDLAGAQWTNTLRRRKDSKTQMRNNQNQAIGMLRVAANSSTQVENPRSFYKTLRWMTLWFCPS